MASDGCADTCEPAVTTRESVKRDVARFWDEQPCGSSSSHEPRGDARFYEDVAAQRYATQPFMRTAIDFDRYAGQRVLEVGCGLGTDLLQFATAGARVVGVDISAQSLALAVRQFRTFETPGDFIQTDAESLPFAEASFDAVYSFGVLHHTPDTQNAIDECLRVLRPGGQFILMLYNRRSWQIAVEPYLVAVKRRLLGQQLPNGVLDPGETARRYDGAENPLGKAYSPAEVGGMLGAFEEVKLEVYSPQLALGSLIVRGYLRILEWSGINRRWGFWILAHARRRTLDATGEAADA